MYNVEFFGAFDIAALMLTLFTLFFFGLIIYLRREDRREGYPIEDDITGRREPAQGMLFVATPKVFRLAHGAGEVAKPDGSRDAMELSATRDSRLSGAPLQPVGDPMFAAVGPGAYAHRAKTPDLTDHGDLKIVPLRDAPDFVIDVRDPDPRGMTVIGADRRPAGVVSDVWVDRGEILIRYLEVELAAPTPGSASGPALVGRDAPGRRVLLPMTMAVVSRSSGKVKVDAILSTQFAGVPALESPNAVTRDEEERICAYYGGGFLYATAARSEPVL